MTICFERVALCTKISPKPGPITAHPASAHHPSVQAQVALLFDSDVKLDTHHTKPITYQGAVIYEVERICLSSQVLRGGAGVTVAMCEKE